MTFDSREMKDQHEQVNVYGTRKNILLYLFKNETMCHSLYKEPSLNIISLDFAQPIHTTKNDILADARLHTSYTN